MAFTITSSAFGAGERIPTRHTCEGDDVSPPLEWTDPPAGTKSFALVIDDPDAPDPEAPRQVWVHWVLYDIPVSARGLPEAASRAGLPSGTRVGTNDWKRAGYGGPCPPVGRHRYNHRIYALDTVLGDRGALTESGLQAAMNGHVLASAELVGTYRKMR